MFECVTVQIWELRQTKPKTALLLLLKAEVACEHCLDTRYSTLIIMNKLLWSWQQQEYE